MNVQLPATEIYIVTGTQGEYEDRRDWTICAYPSKALAEMHVAHATAHMEALRSKAPPWSIQSPSPYYAYWRDVSSPWDPNGVFEQDTSYQFECVQLQSSLPTIAG